MAREGGVGVKFSINGETVFETDEPVANVALRCEQGELAAFTTTGIRNIDVVVEYEGVLNRHLHQVERDRRNERRKEAEERIAAAAERREKISAETTSEEETEDETKTPAFTAGGTTTNE